VTDQSGAVVAGASVTAVELGTNISYKAVSSSAGEFTFANMPVSLYTVTVTAAGFKNIKVDQVPVTAASIYTLPLKLNVASTGETVEVTADALSLDTVTDTQSTALPEEVVQTLQIAAATLPRCWRRHRALPASRRAAARAMRV